MAEKQTPKLKPPFSPRPIPPPPSSPSNTTTSPPEESSSSLQNGNILPRPAHDTAPSIPLTALDSLPTISGHGTHTFLVKTDIPSFLQRDLDLSRLNRIDHLLWMAGRPMRARPLHRYKMMGFEVLVTQQMDLHLLKFSTKVLLKPLPEWILSYEFWEKYLCADEELWKSAAGWILSYVWLLCSPVDLKIAHECFLLPSFVTWHWWRDFVTEFLDAEKGGVDMNALDMVNKRYHFGDLRLGRINSIYRSRFLTTHFVRGYLYGYNRYVVFFQRNFSWILIVFVFFSLVLSAMQVGAGLPGLQENKSFQKASYGFVVFSIVSVGFVLALVGGIFVVIFFFNMGAAIRHDRVERAERERLAEGRKRKEA